MKSDNWEIPVYSMGNLLEAMGELDEAEPIALECYQCNYARFGGKHVKTMVAVRLLADLYSDWGRPDKAAEWKAKLGRP